jgi:hypothetical protein
MPLPNGGAMPRAEPLAADTLTSPMQKLLRRFAPSKIGQADDIVSIHDVSSVALS